MKFPGSDTQSIQYPGGKGGYAQAPGRGPRRPTRPKPICSDAYSRAVIAVVRKSALSISMTGPQGEDRGGSGSGFILTPDGYALTNSHVVHGRRKLRAVHAGGKHPSADLIGDDPATDLALVRLTARDLPLAELGDSESLKWGNW